MHSISSSLFSSKRAQERLSAVTHFFSLGKTGKMRTSFDAWKKKREEHAKLYDQRIKEWVKTVLIKDFSNSYPYFQKIVRSNFDTVIMPEYPTPYFQELSQYKFNSVGAEDVSSTFKEDISSTFKKVQSEADKEKCHYHTILAISGIGIFLGCAILFPAAFYISPVGFLIGAVILVASLLSSGAMIFCREEMENMKERSMIQLAYNCSRDLSIKMLGIISQTLREKKFEEGEERFVKIFFAKNIDRFVCKREIKETEDKIIQWAEKEVSCISQEYDRGEIRDIVKELFSLYQSHKNEWEKAWENALKGIEDRLLEKFPESLEEIKGQSKFDEKFFIIFKSSAATDFEQHLLREFNAMHYKKIQELYEGKITEYAKEIQKEFCISDNDSKNFFFRMSSISG